MPKKIVIATNSPFSEKARNAAVDIIKTAGLEAVVFEEYGVKGNDDLTEQALIKRLQGEYAKENGKINAIITRSDKITQNVINACPGLEVIIRAGAGYKTTIKHSYAEGKGIYVENTPGANAEDVAEEALFIMGMLARNLHVGDTSTKAGEWLKEKLTGKRLSGKKLGIQGLGYVGRSLAQKASDLGMKIFAFDPFSIDTEFAQKYGITIVTSVEDVYHGSDIVSLHFDFDENTKTIGIVNYDFLSLMKQDGMLINCARAEIVNNDDLERILNERPKFKYGADLHPEGDEPGEKWFAKFGDRVVLQPHLGGSTEEANLQAATMAAKQAVEFLVNGVVLNAVNNPIPDYMRPYVGLAEMLGIFNKPFVDGINKIEVTCYSELSKYQNQIAPYIVKGLLKDALGQDATPAQSVAAAKGHEKIKIEYIKSDERRGYGRAIEVVYHGQNGSHILRGKIDDDELHIRKIGDFNLTIPLEPGVYIVATYNEGVGMADKIEGVLTGREINKKRGAYNQSSDRKMAAWYAEIEQINGAPLDFKEIQNMVSDSILKIKGMQTAYAIDLRQHNLSSVTIKLRQNRKNHIQVST